MSNPILQFIEIARETWRQMFYCQWCGKETEHFCYTRANQEIYTCTECQGEQIFVVR